MRRCSGLLCVKRCTRRPPFLTTFCSYEHSVIRHLKPCWFIGGPAVVCKEVYAQEFGLAVMDSGLTCQKVWQGRPFAIDWAWELLLIVQVNWGFPMVVLMVHYHAIWRKKRRETLLYLSLTVICYLDYWVGWGGVYTVYHIYCSSLYYTKVLLYGVALYLMFTRTQWSWPLCFT